MGNPLTAIFEESYPGRRFRWWLPFPPIFTTACDLCPPSRYDGFGRRTEFRAAIMGLGLLSIIRKQPTERSSRLSTACCTVPALIAEIVLTGVIEMKRLGAVLLALCFVLVLISAPFLWRLIFGESLSDLENTLFNILLTAASAWVSYLIARPEADRAAKQRWLPFAENACTQLITIASTAERMRRQQKARCGTLGAFADPELPPAKTLVQVIDVQCSEAAERLAQLRDQIKDARRSWESFIRTHCEGVECAAIEQRLGFAEGEARATLAREVPEPRCVADAPTSKATAKAESPPQQ